MDLFEARGKTKPDYSTPGMSWEEFDKGYTENQEYLDKLAAEAKAKGTLVGRYIREGAGDGYATYIIIKENKKTVRIQHVTGLGDDWHIRMWGFEASIPKDYAMQSIRSQDWWADQVAAKGKDPKGVGESLL
jgi:hypothetical protein